MQFGHVVAVGILGAFCTIYKILEPIYYNILDFWILTPVTCTRNLFFFFFLFKVFCLSRKRGSSGFYLLEIVGWPEELDYTDALNMYAGRKRRKPVQRT